MCCTLFGQSAVRNHQKHRLNYANSLTFQLVLHFFLENRKNL